MLFKSKNSKTLILFTLTFLILLILNANTSHARSMTADDLTTLVDDIKYWYQYGSIFCLIMALGAFVYNIIRLGSASTNTQKRELAIRGMMISGTVAALVPISGIFYGLIINFMSLK